MSKIIQYEKLYYMKKVEGKKRIENSNQLGKDSLKKFYIIYSVIMSFLKISKLF